MEQLPEKATGVLAQFATTSTQIDVFSDQVIESVRQGETDPLLVYTQIKAIAKASERILKEISPNVLTAAEKFPGTKFSFMGNDVQKGSVKTEYDYSKCNDEVWEKFNTEVLTATERRKERETFLKAIKEYIDIVDSNGEAVKLYPPIKTETQGIKLTIR